MYALFSKDHKKKFPYYFLCTVTVAIGLSIENIEIPEI